MSKLEISIFEDIPRKSIKRKRRFPNQCVEVKAVFGREIGVETPEERDVLGLRVLHDLIGEQPVQVSDEDVHGQAVLDDGDVRDLCVHAATGDVLQLVQEVNISHVF